MRRKILGAQRSQWVAAVIVTFCCVACSEQKSTVISAKIPPMYTPPLKPGQTLDMTTDYGKYWPGQPALFKFTEDWGLAIPPQYMQFWIQRDRVVRAPAPWEKIPRALSIGFEFFMPDFGGYTPDNYQDEFHKDRVKVIDFQIVGMGAEQPDASGYYPPNMFARVMTRPSLDSKKYKEIYGLRCYDWKPPQTHHDGQYCYGVRDAKTKEYILLDISPPPYDEFTVHPTMQATYFTPRYGGVQITWRAPMKHFASWHQIDQQIWRFIEAWRISPSTNPKPGDPLDKQ